MAAEMAKQGVTSRGRRRVWFTFVRATLLAAIVAGLLTSGGVGDVEAAPSCIGVAPLCGIWKTPMCVCEAANACRWTCVVPAR